MGKHFSIKKIIDPLGLFLKDKPKGQKKVNGGIGIDTQSDREAQDEAAAEERRRAGASGRASTFFTSALGDVSSPNTASKVLLGD